MIYTPSALGGGGGGAIGGVAPPPSTSDLAVYRGMDFVLNLGSTVSPSHPLWGWAIILLAVILIGYAIRYIKELDFDKMKFVVMAGIILISILYISNNPSFLVDTTLKERITLDEKPTSVFEQKLYIVESFIIGLGGMISPSYPLLGWACVILVIIGIYLLYGRLKEKPPIKYLLLALLLMPSASAYNACIDGDTKVDNMTYVCYDSPSEKVLNQKAVSAWSSLNINSPKIPDFSDMTVLFVAFGIFMLSYLNYRVLKGGAQ